MTIIWTFIIHFLWFYIAAGLAVSVVFWGTRMIKAKNRARFTDEAIHDGLAKGESDPMFLYLVEIFGNRMGVVLMMFMLWPVALYLMIFQERKQKP
ncbi:MAG: hypothetical protein DI537_40845 [Stutzerimonas stutzeri]|nr:MAG: hypothetical protein DI537_40845 [Stutzerimonas stutzeri]